MQHLIRRAFSERNWYSDDLNEVGEFWLRLYERADRKIHFGSNAFHKLEIRIRGFPRPQLEEVKAEMRNRLLSRHFPEPIVSERDADTLVFSSGFADEDERAPEGLGLPWLRGDIFDGLMAEIRFCVAGFRHEPIGKPKVQSTLVMVGELQAGKFLLKAVWRVGATGWEDDNHWVAAWHRESALFDCLEEFRHTETVDEKLATTTFIPRGSDRFTRLVVWLVHIPFAGPRLGGLLLRLLVYGVLFLIGAALVIPVIEGRWYLILAPLLFLGITGWLFYIFCRQELALFFGIRRTFRQNYGLLYAQPIHLAPLPADNDTNCLENPWARKLMAEALAAGCTHAGIVTIAPAVVGNNAVPVYFAPDGVTYLQILLQTTAADIGAGPNQMWPAAFSLMAHTFFQDGSRLASVTGQYEGFRRKRTGPESLLCVFRDVTNPADFLDRHGKELARLERATQTTPIKHVSLEDYLRRQDELQLEERRLFKDNPFSWGDCLHFYLQWMRRAHRPKS